jgi:hypothetical protein
MNNLLAEQMNSSRKKKGNTISLTSNERVGRLEGLGVKDGQPVAEPPYRGEDQQA